MAKYKCTNCNHFYDPERGDKRQGIPAGTEFKDIPNEWRCPACGGPKSKYSRYEPRPFPGYGPCFDNR